MQEARIDAAFQGLQKNMPRAPEGLVNNMIRTVNALEAGRNKQNRIEGRAGSMQVHRQVGRDMTPKGLKPPELGSPRVPGR